VEEGKEASKDGRMDRTNHTRASPSRLLPCLPTCSGQGDHALATAQAYYRYCIRTLHSLPMKTSHPACLSEETRYRDPYRFKEKRNAVEMPDNLILRNL
jgi:hypothetical protein